MTIRNALLLLLGLVVTFACDRRPSEPPLKSSPMLDSFESLYDPSEDFLEDEMALKSSVFDEPVSDPIDVIRSMADQGDTLAKFKLGKVYFNGFAGVRKDNVEAFKWFYRAAEDGNVEAQFTVGMMYMHGKGIQRNYHLAYIWLRRAAKYGLAEAQNTLAFLLESGKGGTKSPSEAIHWYERAANQHHIGAQFNLGLLHYKNRDKPNGSVNAYIWFSLAAKSGNPEAKAYVRRLSREMNAAEREKGNQALLRWRPGS
jgi:TPR repeat protein